MLRKNRSGQCQGLGRSHPCTLRAQSAEQAVELDIKLRSGGIALLGKRGRQVSRHSFLFPFATRVSANARRFRALKWVDFTAAFEIARASAVLGMRRTSNYRHPSTPRAP